MIIGIAGQKGSGKNTVAGFIKNLDESFDIVQFADPIKDMVSTLCVDHLGMKFNSDMNDELTKQMMTPLNVTIRKMLQTIGVEWGRNLISETIWIEIAINKSDHMLIPDLRFINEAEFIKSLGGYIIFVQRPEIFTKDYHQSEIEMHKLEFQNLVDITILNDGDLRQLKKSSETALKEIIKDQIKKAKGK